MMLTQWFTNRSLLTVLLLLTGISAPAHAKVLVDLAEEDGPATWRATGFLWSITEKEPSDDLLMSLKPQLFRCCLSEWDEHGVGMESVVRMARQGVRTQVQISDEYSYRFKGYQYIDHWPGDNGDFSLWDEVIEDCFERVADRGIQVQWDIWEEPNYNNWWRSSFEQFLETWAYAFRKLRELDPQAVIVGPSLSEYNENYLKAFLIYAKKENVLPDILSWHELSDDSPVVLLEHANDIRSFMQKKDIEIDKIDINEYVSPKQVAIPGVHVWYFKYMEEAKIHGACKACWWDKTLWNTSRWPTLDGLLTYPELQPRSTWWVYKAYADITGTLVEVQGSKAVQGVAGIDPETETIRILLGRNEEDHRKPSVLIRNISRTPWVVQRGRVHVTARRIPNTGWEALPEPLTVLDETMQVKNDQVTLEITELGKNEALMIELRAP